MFRKSNKKNLNTWNIPMVINTIENCYSSICICGRRTYLRDMIYNYLKHNQNIDVWMVDLSSEVICREVRKNAEIILYTDVSHPIIHQQVKMYSINVYELLEYNQTKPFEDIYQLIVPKFKKNGIRFICVKSANLRKYTPRGFLSLSMAYFYIMSKVSLKKYNHLSMKHLGTIDNEHDFLCTKMDRLKGYIRVYGNGQQINYDDGFRRVMTDKMLDIECPRIYLFGFCVSANPMLADCDTIASQLQCQVGGKYHVLSRGNDGSAMNLIMREMVYQPGDIVILFTSHKDKMPERLGIETIELTELFQQEKRVWKHITDNSFHLDAYMAKKVAAEISSRINAIGAKDFKTVQDRKVMLSFGSPKKRPPLAAMYKDDDLIEYVKFIEKYAVRGGYNGGIVMNCNPFTLGHQYLVEEAASMCDHLYVFVVQEDKSLFKFKDRFYMVKQGVNHIKNVSVLKSGKFMISSNTLPGYFDKSHLGNIYVSAANDIELFAALSRSLDIKVRFAGTEPSDIFTRKYNQQMALRLPMYGIKFIEIDRLKKDDGNYVSATRFRSIMDVADEKELLKYVPKSTLDILIKNEYVINKI